MLERDNETIMPINQTECIQLASEHLYHVGGKQTQGSQQQEITPLQEEVHTFQE